MPVVLSVSTDVPLFGSSGAFVSAFVRLIGVRGDTHGIDTVADTMHLCNREVVIDEDQEGMVSISM